jgi:hypothetical protein
VRGGGDGIFGVSCGCADASFSIFSRLVVGGDGIFGVSCECGDASFFVFSGRRGGGDY